MGRGSRARLARAATRPPVRPPVRLAHRRLRRRESIDSYATFGATVDLFGDGSVRLLSTPGHTAGHQSVVLRLREREVLLCGDAAYTQRTIAGAEPPAIVDDEHRFRRSLDEIGRFLQQTPRRSRSRATTATPGRASSRSTSERYAAARTAPAARSARTRLAIPFGPSSSSWAYSALIATRISSATSCCCSRVGLSTRSHRIGSP